MILRRLFLCRRRCAIGRCRRRPPASSCSPRPKIRTSRPKPRRPRRPPRSQRRSQRRSTRRARRRSRRPRLRRKRTPQPPPAAAAPAVAPAAAPPQPAPPQPPPSTAAEPQPLVHASQASIKSYLDGIARAANGTIDTQHAAVLQWFTGAADSHLFQSIISLAYPNKVAPHAAAVLLAAPTQGQSCDTSTVQIFPTARPCNAVLADLLKTGKVIADLAGMPVGPELPNGARQLLMPTAGNGCVMVVVNLTFGK